MTDFSLHVTDKRVAAIYLSKEQVLSASAVIRRRLGLPERKVKVISPNESKPERKLEKRSEKVGANMFNLHYFYGALGLVIGMVIAYLLVTFGPVWTQQNPVFTYIALISPGLFVGLFIAGFLSLKPEHDPINQETIEKQDEGKWTLVVDTEDTSCSRDDVVKEMETTEVVEIQK